MRAPGRLFLASLLLAASISFTRAGTYADVDANSVVTNIVAWDGMSSYPLQGGHQLIPYAPPAGIGSTWNGTVFSAPPTASSVPASTASYATQADLAALRAGIPSPCVAVPPSDTLMGAVGVASPCAPRSDAARPTSVQAVNTATDASGSWSVAWARPFVSAAPIVIALPAGVSALPMTCAVQARNAVAASGRCWQAISTTVTAALGPVVPFQLVAANTPVMVVAREPTQ